MVGRSLGRMVGKQLLERHPELGAAHGYLATDFGAIVAAAALAHDIGNPPFGHSGEKAIGTFFSQGKGAEFAAELSPLQKQELLDFEGNANGFRILNASRAGVPGGLRLSYATLGAFTNTLKRHCPRNPLSTLQTRNTVTLKAKKPCFKIWLRSWDWQKELRVLRGIRSPFWWKRQTTFAIPSLILKTELT